MTSAIETSVIVCVYSMERWNDICEAIESLQAGDEPPGEIIIVCDYSTELLERLRARYPDKRVIVNTDLRGLSGARNSGVRAARGTYVAFLDDDAVAGRTWLSVLKRSCEKPNVYGAVAKVLPKWLGARPRWFPEEFLWTVGCTYRGMPEVASPVRNLFGGAMCVRRDLFDRVGGFNTEFGRNGSALPISCEETELCLRANDTIPGIVFMIEPTAVCWHKVPSERLTWRYLVLRCYAEGISKARLTRVSGPGITLSRERSYVLRTLVAGVGHYFTDVVRRGDVYGFMRIVTIGVGFGSAVAGFVVGKLSPLFGSGRVALPERPSAGPTG